MCTVTEACVNGCGSEEHAPELRTNNFHKNIYITH
jgi:hypothetical protein